jgi:hypothetical protein
VSPLKVGDVVEVRSRAEILATLDEAGTLDGLPFMPEMLAFCGRRMVVRKSAHKTCDTINHGPLRRMKGGAAVHLEHARCPGSYHGGCEAGCELFWKEAWLRPIDGEQGEGRGSIVCTEQQLVTLTRQPHQNGTPLYRCQATEMLNATEPMSPWDLRQYVRDVRSGNVRAWALLKSIAWSAFRWMTEHVRGFKLQVWLFNQIQRLRGGSPFRMLAGERTTTPKQRLDLTAGEPVRVKHVDAITRTLDREQKNRGLYYDLEMTPYSGQEHEVERRITRIIDEPTGRMLTLPGDCVLLKGVVCTGRYHRYCPRAINSYWREIWLERAGDGGTPCER